VSEARSLRAARFIDRWRWPLVLASVVLAAVAWTRVTRLSVNGDPAMLLPPTSTSVRDLATVGSKLTGLGSLVVVVKADDPTLRARATEDLAARIRAIDPALVRKVRVDDAVIHGFVWEHRFLYAPLEDVRAARNALSEEITKAKLKANPLYIDFEDESLEGDPATAAAGTAGTPGAAGATGSDTPPAPASAPPATASAPAPGAAAPAHGAAEPSKPDRPATSMELREKLKKAKADRDQPSSFVSKDGRYQLLKVQATFGAGDLDKSSKLVHAVDAAVAESRAALGPAVDFGVTGEVVVVRLEQAAIEDGAILALWVTGALVLLGMLVFYRSLVAVVAIVWSLAVGSLATFALTQIFIGHLNLATAFLAPIVIGNGINTGIMWTARYFEERRAGHDGVHATARALAAAWRGTLAAALAAACAYGSLMITDFRGFQHFGVIGALGMVLCWLSAFTVLPATLALLARRGATARTEPFGRLLAALVPSRPRIVAALSLVSTIAAGIVTVRYLTHDPREKDLNNMRSLPTSTAEVAHKWTKVVDENFGQGSEIGGAFTILAPSRAEAMRVVTRLRQRDTELPEADRLFSSIFIVDDVLPANQVEKLTLLGDIRGMLSEDNLDLMDDDDRRELGQVRPPDELKLIGPADLPEEIAWTFTESDGTRGRLVFANHNWKYDYWKVPQLRELSRRMRAVDLDDGTIMASPVFIYDDIMNAMDRDGPRASVAALIGAIVVIVLIVGVNVYGGVALLTGVAGVLFMITVASLMGLKVNFLDFIALPITIGIGMDYAVNVVARARQDGPGDVSLVVRSTGSAVFLCSYTTIVAYATLWLSNNLGVRSFGLASLIGEITCILAALLMAPALLASLERRRRSAEVRASQSGALPDSAPPAA
jgi:hypothetical protein